ncbi:DinB family protein [Yoonia sp.]|uniref:DinB family protein n=1 Tax=Yoonia sp. TaxID=2212373 RepID=UPI002FDA874D
MITPEYCRLMARYNAWQNDGLRGMVGGMDRETLLHDRGAFWGSIMGTLNHLLWADLMWISRLDGEEGTDVRLKGSPDFTPTPAVWAAERFRMDARIRLWADAVHALDLVGDLAWYSGAAGREITKPKALCVIQMFNHQTHHRGQVHQMLTSLGLKPGDTDLPFMPE